MSIMNTNWKDAALILACVVTLGGALTAMTVHTMSGCDCFWRGVPIGMGTVMGTVLPIYLAKKKLGAVAMIR